MRKTFAATVLAGALAVQAAAALAHHGWAWTTGGNIVLTGIIKTAKLGNPHGILTVDAEGEIWTVEVGQPWRHRNAGLDEAALKPGVEIRAIGEPSDDPDFKRMKVERLFLGKKEYVLYPGRD